MNLPLAPVGILRQIWLWCCTAPWDAGQGELAKFLPALRSHGSPCQLEESGRVRSVALSSQAREKVTTVRGWGLHRATCVRRGDRTGQGAVHLLCRSSILSSWGCQRCHAVSPFHTLSLDLSPKPFLHAHFQTAFPSRAAGCAAPGMRVLDSAPAARNYNPSMLSPILVKSINPLCPLGKCYHSSALHGRCWELSLGELWSPLGAGRRLGGSWRHSW